MHGSTRVEYRAPTYTDDAGFDRCYAHRKVLHASRADAVAVTESTPKFADHAVYRCDGVELEGWHLGRPDRRKASLSRAIQEGGDRGQ